MVLIARKAERGAEALLLLVTASVVFKYCLVAVQGGCAPSSLTGNESASVILNPFRLICERAEKQLAPLDSALGTGESGIAN